MSKSLGLVKTAGLISLIAGIIFIIAGGVTWGMVSSKLAAEKITVAEDASFLAGRSVNGPLTAYSQADIIQHHASDASEGRTYAELGALVRQAEADGDEELAAELSQQRTTVMNASFLRASLFTSVVSFGVAALVIGLGVLLIVQGLAFRRLAVVGEPAPIRQ